MGRSTKPLAYRLVLLFLVLYNEHLMAVNINVTSGSPVTILFEFNSTLCIKGIKYANLNKNYSKTDEWPSTKSRLGVNVTHCTAEVFFSKATAADTGTYYVSLFPNKSSGSYEESAKKVLTVLSTVTGSPTTFHETEDWISTDPSPLLSAYIVIICVVTVTAVVLLILFLSWIYLTHRRSLGRKKSQVNSNTKVTYMASSPSSVYSVEYGVLDFPSRPVSQEGIQNSGPGPESQDGVVYSTITFVPLAQQGMPRAQCGHAGDPVDGKWTTPGAEH